MKITKLIIACFFILSCGLSNAQVPGDPHLIGKDGLPATRSPRYERNDENENRESVSRSRMQRTYEGVENTNQNEEEFSSEETQRDTHFKTDTITVYFFDEKGKRIKSAPGIYQRPVEQDTVRPSSTIRPDTVGTGRDNRD